MQSQVLDLKNFISSIIPPSISSEASSSQAGVIDESAMELIRKNMSYSKNVSEWIDEMLQEVKLSFLLVSLFFSILKLLIRRRN